METQDPRDAEGVPAPVAGEIGKDFEGPPSTEVQTTNPARPIDPRGD